QGRYRPRFHRRAAQPRRMPYTRPRIDFGARRDARAFPSAFTFLAGAAAAAQRAVAGDPRPLASRAASGGRGTAAMSFGRKRVVGRPTGMIRTNRVRRLVTKVS